MVASQPSDFVLAFHTIRFLTCRQIFRQVWHRVRKRWADLSLRQKPPIPPYPGSVWNPALIFCPPGPCSESRDEMLNGDIQFLNSTRQVGWPPVWNQPDASKLWQYNLHYHDFLWNLSFPEAKALVLDWIARCPYHTREIGWECYPLSLRLTNWCACLWGRYRMETESDPSFMETVWHSICQQAFFLEKHLETHLLGNHLLENAVALALTGSCFAGPAAQAWLRQGLAILSEQLPEQMLADGGHFERSPMYHSRVVWCLTTLLNTGQKEIAALVRTPLERGLNALSVLCHPDGQIALLNDSAIGIYSHPQDLLRFGENALETRVESRQSPFALPNTGYYGSRTNRNHYLVCDFAPIGPDYLPGHAHGDIFSFELSYYGHRVIIDSGVFNYDISDTRAYCRSTIAHNTVSVNSQDQCEFWAAFRVARRGRPHDVRWTPFESGFRLQGWHDGYHRLKGKPKHARTLTWHNAGILLIRDEITAQYPIEGASRIHLHPDCTITLQNKNSVHINSPAGPVIIKFAGPGELHLEQSTYSPEFGRRLANKAIVWSASGSSIHFGCCIAPLSDIDSFDINTGAVVGETHYRF
jgi:uncharacterized heparinase superfamily protein